MDSVLRPRDIQARIRSGESPESVAAAAQTTVDKIIGFATPVLAERAYVAQQAQKASVRRRAGDGPVGLLGQAVAERLASRDIDPESVEWDAWRREDGRWTLVADFGAGQSGRRASFVYDTAGRYVVADDDESRWLVGERHGSEVAPTPAPTVTRRAVDSPLRATEPGRRLSAVGTEQLPLGDDAIELVTGRRPADLGEVELGAVEPPEDPTVDLTEARSVVRSAAPDTRVSAEPEALFDAPAAPVVPPRQAAADEAEVLAGRPSRGHLAEAGAGADEIIDEAAGAAAAEATDSATGPAADDASGTGEEVVDDRPQQRKASRGRGRASVPSWDEIMFGSSRGE
ncbi:MAG: hypothetical protein QOK15_3743 [Nocardioidaceae bacterium]|nr:hypothetical protein [Nocardioidaceae bacterium]